ncbi:hypothetical protein ABID22_003687 [Pontibacter aydingkolensis]
MTVTNIRNHWPYLTVRLIAISIMVTPPLTSLFAAIINAVFNPQYGFEIGFAFITMGWTLLVYTWAFLFCVLLPYSLICVYTSLHNKNVFLKLCLFYLLIALSGIIAPELTVTGAFNVDVYPRALGLYFLLTITICPLVNIPLDKIVRNRMVER